MKIKAIFMMVLVILLSQTYAGNLLKLTNEPLIFQKCPIYYTSNPLDLATNNDGYFVLSKGKKDSEKYFTRYGEFGIGQDSYIRHTNGDYLLKVTKKLDPNHLSKIKIPFKNLPPKATSYISGIFNLPADGFENYSSLTIYDSLSNAHVLTLHFKKDELFQWSVEVLHENVLLDTGKLLFKHTGELDKQVGLHHVQWAVEYGMHELKIDLKGSTQFASPFSVMGLGQDGYRLGRVMGLDVRDYGEIFILYDNGHTKALKGRIALAKFTNEKFLEFIPPYLYKPTEKSGQPNTHWANSERAIMSGVLEQASCFK